MADNTQPVTRFQHQRLDAYRVAVELVQEVELLAKRFPRGHADLKDQLRRAAAATVRHIAEGANRITPRDKAARYVLAMAECGEAEASLELANALGIASGPAVLRVRQLADRVGAMCWGLLRSQRAREA
jgi:four helix bundle protein